jgi:hypothetical protein
MQSLINVRQVRNTLLVGLIVGLSLVLSSWVNARLSYLLSLGLSYLLSSWLSLGLGLGLSYWLLLGLFNGLSSDTLDERRRITPNQGIRRSARNSILVGLISGLVSFPIVILCVVLSVWLSLGLIVGLSGGLLAGLLNGGLACIQHGVLRWLLWRSGFIPRNYVRFLDFAAERILLRKVGGGYIFYVDKSLPLRHIPHNSARQQAAKMRPLTSSIQPCGPKARVRGILVCCTV